LSTDIADESPEAIFERAKRFYFPHQGADPDPEVALSLFRQAASLGYAPAQRLLGICLLEGSFCPKNLDQARFWLTEAASRSDPQACLSLALIYAQGLGTPKRWDLAWSLLSRPEAEALPEARELKMKLKAGLVALYPEINEAVAKAENARRALLDRRQTRFIAPFWPVGRLEGRQAEYFALLDLNLGKISREAALAAITKGLEDYYSEMTAPSAPPHGGLRPSP
jgi:hypothetical protein